MANDIDQLLQKKYTNILRPGFVTCKGTLLLDSFKENQTKIENFQVRDDDIWITTFPKSGTTWMQEMVWLIANDLDYEGAKVIIPERFPFIEFKSVLDFGNYKKFHPDFHIEESILDPVEALSKRKPVRFIKTHLPWNLLPLQIQNQTKNAKVICVIRNPKDVCISYYHHSRAIEGCTGNFDEFFQLFLAGKVLFGPYWECIMSYWQRRHLPNVFVVTYEEMKRDLLPVIRRVAKFLGKTLTDDQIEKLKNHLSFESMKKNPAVNYEPLVEFVKKCIGEKYASDGIFMRTGTVGNHKSLMSKEQIDQIDKWTEEHITGTGLKF